MNNNELFKEVKGDGYCFFRAIHASLGLDPEVDGLFGKELK